MDIPSVKTGQKIYIKPCQNVKPECRESLCPITVPCSPVVDPHEHHILCRVHVLSMVDTLMRVRDGVWLAPGMSVGGGVRGGPHGGGGGAGDQGGVTACGRRDTTLLASAEQ